MDKSYVTLFKDLAQATAASAETVMDYNRQKDDQKGLETATIMRDDYQALADKIVDDYEYVITKADAAKLLVGAMIMVNQLQDRITGLKKAMAGYQTDLIPKLQEIVDASTEDEARKLAGEKFIIKDNE
jgi:hypothetical protein